MKEAFVCCSYGDYLLKYDTEKNRFHLFHKGVAFVENAELTKLLGYGEKAFTLSDYSLKNVINSCLLEENQMVVSFLPKKENIPSISFVFNVNYRGVTIELAGTKAAHIQGEIHWGVQGDALAVNLNGGPDFRSAIGPATSTIDNAIYNRKNDSAVCVCECPELRLKYDFVKQTYCFVLDTCHKESALKFRFEIREKILSDKLNFDFVPMKKRSGYAVPPSGWMTWYAVGFNASQETVLRNVEFQEKYLKNYGADTVWVDWEWCHNSHEPRRSDGVDTFHPDPKKYPNGLKYISDKIKKAGFTPAIWIGFTNDLSHNRISREYSEMILCEEENWCGTFFYDFTYPAYLEKFLPQALAQVKEWGYETVKFDTLPISRRMHEKYHDCMYDPSLTTQEAYQRMVRKVREVLGDNVYMLSCAAEVDSDILWGVGVFDAARIGQDVFSWKDFLKECVDKAKRYYQLHNIVLYNDPDNLVLREAFNTMDEAISRVSFISLLGMPVTFGDDLPALQPERIDLLRRALPVQDIHPMSFGSVNGNEIQIVNLSIALPFECYNVVQVMNRSEETREKELDFYEDLHLEPGEYYVYDFFKKEFKGLCKNSVLVSLASHASAILCVRSKQNRPQVISTSRHITQGAAEIKQMLWDEEKCTLKMQCELPVDELYTVTVIIPEGYKLLDSNFDAIEENGECICLQKKATQSTVYDFYIRFEKTKTDD